MPAATEATDKASATCFAWTAATGGGATAGTTFATSYGGCAEGAADCAAWEAVYTSGQSAVAGGITNWQCNVCQGDDCNSAEYAPSPAPTASALMALFAAAFLALQQL